MVSNNIFQANEAFYVHSFSKNYDIITTLRLAENC